MRDIVKGFLFNYTIMHSLANGGISRHGQCASKVF